MSFERLDRFLTDCTTRREIAGCVCWIGDGKETFFFESYGYAQKIPQKRKISNDTIFDLASITKPIVTALSVVQLCEMGKVRLHDKIEKYLPIFRNTQNGGKTIQQFLTHTAGVPSWFPLYLLSQEERVAYLTQKNTDKAGVTYSCLGYIILGKLVEAVSGKSLKDYCEEHIIKKLDLKNTMYGPVARNDVAATELGNAHEKKLARRYGSTEHIPWRENVINGEVHDGNSYYVYGGVSGNAGLFSSAADLATIARRYLAGDIVSMKSLNMMLTDHTGGKEQRGLGWVINPYPQLFSAGAFSHTGFTGTMLLVVRQASLIVILLTNAVHPRVRVSLMPSIRYRFVRLVSTITKDR